MQLYTVRDALAQDLPGTLRRIRALGYRNVELYGFVELADAYRQVLPELGPAAPSAHARLLGADLRPILAAAVAVGSRS